MKCENFKPKNEEELKELCEEYAKKVGIKPNPDEKVFEGVLKGLMRNQEKHGEVYCPCRVVTGDKEKDEEIICPCVFHRGEIEMQGRCKCFLFVKNGDKT